MILASCKFVNKIGFILKCENLLKLSICRNGHTLRGKPPGVARSLEQRLKELNQVNPELAKKINIGFPKLRPKRSLQLKERLAHVKAQKTNLELEKKARSGALMIDLDEVRNIHLQTSGQFSLRTIADHYGVYKDLFGDAYFIPRVPLDIMYKSAEDTLSPVYCGNIVMPSEAVQKPEVNFNGTVDLLTGKDNVKGNYWTLVLTNPDGHFSGEEKEYLHWFVANIPDSDVAKGEEIVSYLQPTPPMGLGYQRFIFILYKQDSKLDLSEYKINKTNDLDSRTFSTFDFYKKHQNMLTPAGLSFFQSTWDRSLTKFYHENLGTKEPVYEYDFPAPYIAKQKWFPLKQPFNLYMDKYRDPKKIQKEYLERKLAKVHPFDGPEPELRFPNAHPLRNIPSWLKTELRKQRLKIGRVNDV